MIAGSTSCFSTRFHDVSGHSKWATIKRKKAANDAKRGKLFARLVRAIELAAKDGSDPAGNATLGAAVAKARSNSVPVEIIERAIKRGSGDVAGVVYEEIWYEGYGPGGVAIYVQVLTDNRNRAASDVRAAFTRNGGNLGEPGSVSYLFDAKGYLEVTGDEDSVMLAALEAGAEDVQGADDQFEVYTAPSDVTKVGESMMAAGINVENVEVTRVPKASVRVDASTAPKVIRLVDALEDLDDVQTVFANYEIDDAILETLA